MDPQSDETPPAPPATAVQRRGMRDVIIAQSFGCTGLVAFKHGLILLLLTALEFGSALVMVCLTLPFAFRAVLTIPGAYWADRYGKKRLGRFGLLLTAVGFGTAAGALFLEGQGMRLGVVAGLIAFAVGDAFMASSWFALLSAIVPENKRGRFFGRLRFSWQTVGIAFFAVASFLLAKDSPPRAFVPLLAAIAVGQLVRFFTYLRIPELEKPVPRQQGFVPAFLAVLRSEGYMSFCAYVFLLSLVTMGCPHLFGLIEKKVLLLYDAQVVWLGNLGMIGAVTGFLFGGKAIDRWGTKPVFLFCHFGYALVLALFLLRGVVPTVVWLTLVLGALNFAFGILMAASSVAISTEMLALIPAENKSLSTSLCMTLLTGGTALSGVLAAGMLKVGVLRETWQFWGMELSDYDGVLLIYGLAVLLLVVTLGLVPSIIGRAQWVPRSS